MSRKKITSDNEVEVLQADVIDAKVYNKIAKCAHILGLQLIESNFSVSPNFFEDENTGNLSVDFSDIHGSFDENNRVTTTIFQFETYKRQKRKKVFSLKDKFVVFYHIPIDCDELHAVAFSKQVGLMACYPYFRSHAAQTAALANADMPILPTIASMPLKEKVKKEEAE